MNVYHFTPRSRNRLERQLTRSQSVGNVLRLTRPAPVDPAEAFKALTARLVMAQHKAGTLHPNVVEALLAGVGLRP